MKAWWIGLAQREQRMIASAVGFLVLFLLYAAVWSPLQNSRAQLSEQAEQQRATLQWMQQTVAEIRQLSAGGSGRRPTTGQSLLGLIDQSARAQRLAEAVKRVQPDGAHSVRVWLENAAFDDVMQWLGLLEKQNGVVVEALNVERGEQEGRVNARLTLEGPK